jgi:post-segregation antitoxin (ccd killing protein)
MLVSNTVQWAMMKTARKITVEVPAELLERAQRAGGAGITQTVRTGLQLVAATQTYTRLRQLRGKVRFSRTLAELKVDR